MNKSFLVRSCVLAGGLFALCTSVSSLAAEKKTYTESLSKYQHTIVAGETPESLRAYKQGCPECVKVAQDIASMRQQYCADKQSNVDSVIAGDPVYAYLNGVRMVLMPQGGYYSPMYTSARQIVEANVDCVYPQDWINRSQHVLTQTFNNGKPLG